MSLDAQQKLGVGSVLAFIGAACIVIGLTFGFSGIERPWS